MSTISTFEQAIQKCGWSTTRALRTLQNIRPNIIWNLVCERLYMGTHLIHTTNESTYKTVSVGSKGHFTQKTEAHDHCNLRALIGRKGGNRPSALYTRT